MLHLEDRSRVCFQFDICARVDVDVVVLWCGIRVMWYTCDVIHDVMWCTLRRVCGVYVGMMCVVWKMRTRGI